MTCKCFDKIKERLRFENGGDLASAYHVGYSDFGIAKLVTKKTWKGELYQQYGRRKHIQVDWNFCPFCGKERSN